jgi:uncharacterized protein
LPGARVFDGVIAVGITLGGWLLVARRPEPATTARSRLPAPLLVVLSALIGCVGGIYGIGGGSILAPILIGSGRPPSEVAPATLTSTFLTSIAGVVTFALLATHGSVAPDWGVGIALGAGGLAGGYVGARLQPRLPESIIRRLLGLLVLAIGVRYAWLAT